MSQRRWTSTFARLWGRFDIWLVAVLALAALVPGIVRTPFHPDESHWISTSRYLEVFVLVKMMME